MVGRLDALAPDDQRNLLVEMVCSQAAAVLGHPAPEEIDPDTTFKALGFDSLTGVELRNHFKTATGLALSPTLIFDHPTPTAVADYIGRQLAESRDVTVRNELGAERLALRRQDFCTASGAVLASSATAGGAFGLAWSPRGWTTCGHQNQRPSMRRQRRHE